MPDHEDSVTPGAPDTTSWGQPAWSADAVQPAQQPLRPQQPPPAMPDAFGGRAPWDAAPGFAAQASGYASGPAAAGYVAAQSALPAYGAAPLYDLRPLSTGEILDRTFSLYRKRFWLFAGLAVVASGIRTLSAFVQLTWGTIHNPAAVSGTDPFAIFRRPEFTVLIVTVLITGFLYWFVYSLTQAATVHAVSEIYLGRETTIKASFMKVREQWFRYAMIAFWQGWSAIWLPLTLGLLAAVVAAFSVKVPLLAIVALLLIFAALLAYLYGAYAWMRNSLGIVAAVVENLSVKDALIRSKALTHNRLLRVLALLLLLIVLGIAASVAQAIPGGLLGIAFAASQTGLAIALEALALVVTFVTGALLLPVGAIAFCLFYIDERVRREGFDVETLLGLGAAPPAAAEAGAGGVPGGTQSLTSPFSGPGLG